MSEALAARASFPPNPASQEPRTASSRYQGDTNEALDGATEALTPETVECGGCGCAFTTTDAYDVHRPNGKCLSPIDAGLVVSPRIRLTWSVPVRVPTAVDPFGNVTEWIDCDPDVAGMWDQRCWHNAI